MCRKQTWFSRARSTACLAVLALLAAPRGFPVDYPLLVDQWSRESDLGIGSVNALTQTSDGLVWMATWYGLVRFDGVRFTIFDSASHPELVSSRLTRVFRSRDDSLWLTTEHGQLIRFVRGRFEQITRAGVPIIATSAAANEQEPLFGLNRGIAVVRDGEIEFHGDELGSDVTAVTWRPDGDVWAGTVDGGLFQLRHDSLRFTEIASFDTSIRSLEYESPDRIWIGTNDGLYRLSVADGTSEILSDRPILSVEAGPDRVIRVMTEDGIWRVDGAGLERMAETDSMTGVEPMARPCLNGRVCVNASPRVVDSGGVLVETGSTIRDMLEDRGGGLWIATNSEGLFFVRRSRIGVLAEKQGLVTPEAYSIFQGRNGAIWIGTIGGLARWDGKETRWWDRASGFPFQSVWSVFEDAGGTVWVGGDEGLCTMNDDACDRVDLPGAATTVVRAVFEDSRGVLWIGSRDGLFRRREGRIEPFGALGELSGGPMARVFAEDRDGGIWVGTSGAGLYRIDAERAERMGVGEGLSSDTIRALHVDRDGRLWVGTEGHGLCRIAFDDAGSRSVDCINSSQGLHHDAIHQILDDGLGRFWISTNRGVSSVEIGEVNAVLDGRRRRIDTRIYVERDGLPDREANGGGQSAGIMAADGQLWFPTQGGVAVIDPRLERNADAAPVAIIESISEARRFDEPVVLSRGERDVIIRFTAPHFANPDVVRLRHRLVGYDKEWLDAGPERVARYTGLPPGEYEVEVQASLAGDTWRTPAAKATLVVPPYFWETIWFQVPIGGLLLLMFAWAGGKRTRWLERRRRELEREVQARTVELTKQARKTEEALGLVRRQKEELEEMSEAKTRFFANVSHELRTPLTLIIGPLEDHEHLQEPLAAHELMAMLRNARRLRRLVDQMLDLQKVDSGRMELDLRRVDLREIVVNSVDVFRTFAARQEIEIRLEVSDVTVPVAIDWEQMEKVVGNLLSNALKFSGSGSTVTVVVRQASELAELTVSDDGPGIPAAMRERIFERFFRVATTDHREGTGIGLSLVREIVLLHGGDVSVETQEGAGTTFQVRLPLSVGPVEQAAERDPWMAADAQVQPVPRLEPGKGQERPRVLVVDDHADIRAYVRRILEDAFEVLEAATGEHGLEIARRELPDLVVTDVMMPGIDGFELGRRLRKDPETASLLLIFLTARTTSEDEIEAFSSGGDQFVRKPFTAQLLQARVRAALERRDRFRRELLDKWRRESGKPSFEKDEAMPETLESRARQIILDRIHDDPPLTVDALARALAISRTQMFRRLKEEADTTPQALIRNVRLARAAELLSAGAGNVSEIAIATGFASLSHFSRVFRERYGVPPTDYISPRGQMLSRPWLTDSANSEAGSTD